MFAVIVHIMSQFSPSLLYHSAKFINQIYKSVNLVYKYCIILCFSWALYIATLSWRTYYWILTDTLYSPTSAWAKNSFHLRRYDDMSPLNLVTTVSQLVSLYGLNICSLVLHCYCLVCHPPHLHLASSEQWCSNRTVFVL